MCSDFSPPIAKIAVANRRLGFQKLDTITHKHPNINEKAGKIAIVNWLFVVHTENYHAMNTISL